MKSERDAETVIIYDGECIFCQNYVKLVRLQESVGRVSLVDARSNDPLVIEYQRAGYDLNVGMLFIYKGQVYHGAEAVHAIAMLSSSLSLFNQFNRLVFSNRAIATAFYPLLRLGRRVSLLARGKALIAR
jgi:predicted DCC family thiol-disulfide oxidoreductase YuxK